MARCKGPNPGPNFIWLVTLLTLLLFDALILNPVQAAHSNPRHTRQSNTRSRFKNNSDLTRSLHERHNHKPVFTNCSGYAPVVKEEQPIGTFVIQVHADDQDPPDEGGTVTYYLVAGKGEKLKFAIDRETGVITTTAVLDRDEPAREKEVYLTVLASDNGRPQLDDVCTFKVTVEDINDNAPIFDKEEYKESVPQDQPVNREVMRISATDIDDGLNSVVRYSITPKKAADADYFRIDANTGVIYLNKSIDREPEYKFVLSAMAKDMGEEPQFSVIDVEIKVVEPHKKSPSFTVIPLAPIQVAENFSDYEAPIARIEAISNIKENPDYYLYELLIGRTEQTNKENNFRLISYKNVAEIKLARALDYETITDYTLRVRVQNQYELAAETDIRIEVLDVNDNIPLFREMTKGTVLENEPAGTPIMQVRAIDFDGTSAHNQVTYSLANYADLFEIDEKTGNITTLISFDREDVETYTVKVIATDNSPSALFKTGEHNKGEQNFRVEIADKNDNPPRFTQRVYVANGVPEDANVNSLVTEVRAIDADTATTVVYSIIDGNVDDSFKIEGLTGKIRVNKPLDYEKTTQYNLTVRAFDGLFDDTAVVRIYIENVNDNAPVFLPFDKNPWILEETLFEGCITTVKAYDPDIEDRNADQHIVYSILKPEQQSLVSIDKDGCMRLKKPLDRDRPNGTPVWSINVVAQDEDGGPNSLKSVETVYIHLIDINDNAPFLNMPEPVIWYENEPPGFIVKLKADDYDTDENGPPFSFRMGPQADSTILKSFEVRKDELWAKVTFDREERKSYDVPVAITDSGKPPLTGVSILTVTIGDRNDNAMKDGHSSIFVYNYTGMASKVKIGRVYVDDPDDWDLDDKTFYWKNDDVDGFDLDRDIGMITLDFGGIDRQDYLLEFRVSEQSKDIPLHYVSATVNVTIKNIPEEAVTKSGSIRFIGINAEEFVAPDSTGMSKKTSLQKKLANILNAKPENVDVFTVLHSPHQNKSVLDVRFSAHGSPYYEPEKLNTMVNQEAEKIELGLGANILLVSIDECLFEKVHCNDSCSSVLNTYPEPYAVFTNLSSFVGVNAVVDPQCTCKLNATAATCLNDGVPVNDNNSNNNRCKCPNEQAGPRCECLAISFNGHGYAVMPPTFQTCEESHLSLEITPRNKDGLVFYFGPMRYSAKLGVADFMALELKNGNPTLYVDYGQGTVVLDEANSDNGTRVDLMDGNSHRIDIFWKKLRIEMEIDNCGLACRRFGVPVGSNEFLNVNSPLQIGGSVTNLQKLRDSFGWQYAPTDKGFDGRISKLKINGVLYNLGQPSMWQDAESNCMLVGLTAGFKFGIATNFLLTIGVCLAILLILVLAVVVHRRKSDDVAADNDEIRQSIINYEDEGGGEVDATYDLKVLQTPCAAEANLDDFEIEDLDDVRHYAYEGEGDSDGSLSSLASCTDDEDLKFDYVMNFGPRFRKIASIYGEESNDDDSNANSNSNRGSGSWC